MSLLFQNEASKISPFLDIRPEARSCKGGNLLASHMRDIVKRNKIVYFLSKFNIMNEIPSSKEICETFCSESERY